MNVLARIGPRLAATFALVAALGVAISSVIVYRTTAADLRGRLRENTVTRLEAAADLFGASERLVAGARVDDPGLPPALRRAAAPNRAVSYFDGQHMWAVQRFPGRGVLSVSQPADTDRAFLDRLVRLFTMAGLAAALVATLVGAFIAARISRRLARIGTVAQAATDRSRFSSTKDVSFVPLRPERVVEVSFDQLEGWRFRHAVQFLRWRPDRDPRSCSIDQIDRAAAYDLGEVLTDAEVVRVDRRA